MLRPIRENILVKPFMTDGISAGGIIVSDAHRLPSNKLKVIAVGNGTKQYPMNFKPGDVVFRVKDCGDEVLIEGELHYIVKSNWLLAKMN